MGQLVKRPSDEQLRDGMIARTGINLVVYGGYLIL